MPPLLSMPPSRPNQPHARNAATSPRLLPLSYFQKRNVGNLLQRFHALEPVKQMIVGGGISTVLDGTLAVFTLILMFRYSAVLSSIVLGVFLL